jgi:hypothetical protein
LAAIRPTTFCSGLELVTEAHPTPAMLGLLAETYAQQLCLHRRHQALVLLADHGAVPDWLREEVRLDAHPGTRRLLTAGQVVDVRSSP